MAQFWRNSLTRAHSRDRYCAGYYSAIERLTKLKELPKIADAIARVHDQAQAKLTFAAGVGVGRRSGDRECSCFGGGGPGGGGGGRRDLSIGACLIRPVKRLCLYPLLLDALQKALHGAPDERIRPRWERKIASAVESMALVTATVNSKVREAEERLKMLELHERLRGAVALAPHRSFVLEKDVKCAKRSLRRGSFTDFAPKEYRLLPPNACCCALREVQRHDRFQRVHLGALKLARLGRRRGRATAHRRKKRLEELGRAWRPSRCRPISRAFAACSPLQRTATAQRHNRDAPPPPTRAPPAAADAPPPAAAPAAAGGDGARPASRRSASEWGLRGSRSARRRRTGGER